MGPCTALQANADEQEKASQSAGGQGGDRRD